MKKKRTTKITDLIAAEIAAQAAPPKPVVLPPAPPQLTNHVIFLLDDSGSMNFCYTEAVRQLNAQFATVREKAKQFNQKTTVSLYLFGGQQRTRNIYFQQPVETLKDLGFDFASGGSTPLIDAVCSAITDGKNCYDASSPNTSFLVICATDGGENSSRFFTLAQLQDLLRITQATDRWTYAFMVPPGNKFTMTRMGVPADNIIEWNNDVAGARMSGMQTNHSLGNYFLGRERGVTSSKQFYTTDLSKITGTDLSKMTDVSRNFKSWNIDREVELQTFVESHGATFVTGAGYYLLMKKELLRDGRQVLVQEKGSKRLFGGAQARKILGLPDGEVHVTPGNHSNYDVYFQSTSHNRNLIRGTKLYYDMTQQPGIKGTWDPVAAQAAADAKKATQQTT